MKVYIVEGGYDFTMVSYIHSVHKKKKSAEQALQKLREVKGSMGVIHEMEVKR